jgi:methanogenic corrinoid protein MtbC1
MINWCAYCQQFQGERPPYEDYSLTHGICPACAKAGVELTGVEFDRIIQLKKIHKMLLQAGLKRDKKFAEEAIHSALEKGSRPVDVIMGVISPLLWEIGDLWKNGKITVADEHRFTAFYDSILKDMTLDDLGAKGRQGFDHPDIILLNVPGNRHYLGVQVMVYWLLSKGFRCEAVTEPMTFDRVVLLIEEKRPRFLGFSIGLPGQISGFKNLIGRLRERFSDPCPRILLGGNAVKQGMVEKMERTTLIFDVDQVCGLLKTA